MQGAIGDTLDEWSGRLSGLILGVLLFQGLHGGRALCYIEYLHVA
jgi:hypothetical protein